MKFLRVIAAIGLVALLGACASPPQQPVAFSANSSVQTGTRVGVVVTKLPVVDTSFPGAGCLLCYAAASLANSSLTAHVKTLDGDDILQVRDDIASAMKKKGAEVVVIETQLDLDKLPDASAKQENTALKDFRDFSAKHQVDKLVVISIGLLGVERTYSAYIPTSDPKGVVRGVGYMVNATTGAYEWFQPIDVSKAPAGNWDEGPKFPGVTNAYYQAVETARDQLVKPFLN